MSGAPAVFVDRDGTLIREVGYLSREEQLELLPQVPEAIRLLHRHGFKVVVITNQSAVARGILREDELREIHRELERRLAGAGGAVDGIYYCPHHPTEGLAPYRLSCDCRKPSAGLVERAAKELGLDPSRSYVVGDQMSDMELAARIGAKGIFIRDPQEGGAQGAVNGPQSIVVTTQSLWSAAQWIVQDLRNRGRHEK